jgi:hypothetical protein
MPTNREEIELAFKIEMETRKALGEVSKIDKSLRNMVNNSLKIKDFDSKSLRDFRKEAGKTAKDLNDIAMSMSPRSRKRLDGEFRAVESAYKKLASVTRTERTKISKIEEKLSKATLKDDKLAAKEELALAKKTTQALIRQAKLQFANKRKALGEGMVATGATKDIEKRTSSANQTKEFIDNIKSTKVGAEMADGFKEAIEALRGKDIFGIGKAGYKVSAGMLKGVAKFSMAHGAGIAAKGESKGGLMGGAMKGVGKAMEGIGPLLGTLSKLAPVLGLVGGAVMGLVKLFLDADAAVKEMNKTVLEGASTWDLYSSQGKDVGMGMMHLDDILSKVRDQTTDLKMNLKMGTLAKDHQQFLNTLGREGISLQRIDSTLEENKTRVDDVSKSLTKYSDISSMAISYSRLFGVSLDEIAQFQGEMMRDLGVSLNDVGKEFDKIGNAADSSGIAANKFFAILRSVSSDLGLYGVRIGEATKMLGQLGKVMSPRTADKFLKTFSQGLSGKSINDRLKLVLLGGGGAVKAIQQDIEDQKKDIIAKLAGEAGVSPEDAKKLLEGGRTGKGTLTEMGASGKVKDVGTMREAYKNATRNEKSAKLGVYGAAAAAKNMSGFGSFDLQRQAILKRSGSKSIEGAVGLKGEAWGAQVAGSEDALEALRGMERGLEQQREDLVNAVDNPEGNKELIAELKNMGVIDKSASDDDVKNNALMLKKKIKEMKESDVWKSLDKKNAEASKSQAEKDAEAMLQMGKEQGTRTQSILDAVGAIFDALFNWIYQILTDIYSALKIGGDLQKRIYKSQNKDLMKAWKESGGDESKFMGALANSATGKKMGEVLASDKPGDAKSKNSLEQLISSKFDSSSALAVNQLFGAMKEQKLTKEQQEAVTTGMHKEGGLRQGVKEAGLSAQQEAAIFAKVALWGTQASTRADIIEDASKILGTGAAPSVATPTEVPAQQQATAAAANPGSGGGSVAVAAPPPAAPATAPGAGPAGTPGDQGPNKIPTVPDEQKMNAAVLDQVDFTGAAVVGSLQDLWNALRMKGIKFDRTQLEGLYQDVIHKGTYLGAQDALAEYALYTASDPSGVLKKMKDSGFQGVGKLATTLEGQMDEAKKSRTPGHAAGGLVTGISGGMAQISPAAGEGLASIGRGERILPAGGGGGASISLTVNGIGGQDLANFLKEKVNQGIHEYKRREKFT